MATTFVKIASVTVSTSTSATIDFQNIPATYTDLCLVASVRTDKAGTTINGVEVRLNNDSTSGNYTARRLYGSGTSAVSDTNNLHPIFATAANSTASVFGNNQVYIPNYTSSNYKSMSAEAVNENNATEAYQGLIARLWSNTSVVNRITLVPEGANFVQYSTATLYGIKSS